MPQDPKTIERYRNEVVEEYSAMAILARVIYDGLKQKEKDQLTQSFEKFYKPRFINALNLIGFCVNLPEGFEIINIDDVVELPDEGAIGGDNDDDLDFLKNESFNEAMQSRMQSRDDDVQTNEDKRANESNQNDNTFKIQIQIHTSGQIHI